MGYLLINKAKGISEIFYKIDFIDCKYCFNNNFLFY